MYIPPVSRAVNYEKKPVNQRKDQDIKKGIVEYLGMDLKNIRGATR